MKDTINKLNKIMTKSEHHRVAGLIVMMFIGGVLELIGVAGVSPIISVIISGKIDNPKFIIFMCIGLIMVYLIKNAYLTFMYKCIFDFVYSGRSKLAIRLFKVYLNAPYSFHLNTNVSILQRSVRNDVDGCYTVIKDLLQIFAESVICCILSVLLFFTDFVMALFLSLLLLLLVGTVVIISRKIVRILGSEEMEHSTKMNQWLMQGIGGIKETKILGRENYFEERFSMHSVESSKCNKKQQLISLFPRMLTETVCIAGVMLWLIILVINGTNMLDAVPKLAVFAVAAFRLLPVIGKINALMAEYHFYKIRVDFVYNELENIDVSNELENIDVSNELKNIDVSNESQENEKLYRIENYKEIEVRDLSFAYENQEHAVLENVNIRIHSGESIGIAGPSGAGKTTLVDIIMGLLNPTSGDILVDGNSIYDNLKGWYSMIGYVPQDIYLTDDTIKNNIAFGINDCDIDADRVMEAVKKAQLDVFLSELPEGIDTVVGERGVRLSGGQRQRIGIARALYQSPEMLVMDEATSALDNETESAVMEAIEALHGKVTMIIIAHRLSTIEKCDRIYTVDDGQVYLK